MDSYERGFVAGREGNTETRLLAFRNPSAGSFGSEEEESFLTRLRAVDVTQYNDKRICSNLAGRYLTEERDLC